MSTCSSNCIQEVQFPGITPATGIISINGLNAAPGTTSASLVASNPMFYFDFGIAGQNTLVCGMNTALGIDLTIVTGAGPVNAVPFTRHPIHAPR